MGATKFVSATRKMQEHFKKIKIHIQEIYDENYLEFLQWLIGGCQKFGG